MSEVDLMLNYTVEICFHELDGFVFQGFLVLLFVPHFTSGTFCKHILNSAASSSL